MIWAGLLLGFVGSLHCVGMCGPIAIAAFGKSEYNQVTSRIVYNFGRTFTYTLMGLAMGLAGQVVKLSGIQQTVSIVLGLTIVLFTTFYFLGIKSKYVIIQRPLLWTQKQLSNLIRKKGLVNRFSLGVINGFLPCGLVYMALAGAIVTENIWDSVGFMFLFGLGTIPALFGITYIAPTISRVVNINKWIPYMFAIVGVILVLRGLGLGIPFISPDLSSETSQMHTDHM